MTARRHRIHSIEFPPAHEAVTRDLQRRIEERNVLLSTTLFFRLWYRIETRCTHKPIYPPHETWEDLELATGYGTTRGEVHGLPDRRGEMGDSCTLEEKGK